MLHLQNKLHLQAKKEKPFIYTQKKRFIYIDEREKKEPLFIRRRVFICTGKLHLRENLHFCKTKKNLLFN